TQAETEALLPAGPLGRTMAAGDVFTVDSLDDVHYVDTGMYDTPEYGAAYIVDAERPAVVDTGIGTHYDRLVAAIESVGLAPADIEVIAPTHVHLDHAGGAGFLAADAPDAEVYVHEIGAPHLVDPDRLVEGTKRAVGDQWEFYVEPRPIPESRVVPIGDGDTIDLGDRELVAVHAPGHAPHQVVFHEPSTGWVHTADAAGIWVPALERIRETTPPPNFEFEQALADIETVRDLDPSVLLYPHFGPVERVEHALDAYEEGLKQWVAAIEREYERRGDEEAVVEHFVAENEMEDLWGAKKARGETAMNVRGVLRYLNTRDD
ncbi:MAG: MBL fold metallo-hydrolase, partial [Halodesulfurarchaeum sp.]